MSLVLHHIILGKCVREVTEESVKIIIRKTKSSSTQNVFYSTQGCPALLFASIIHAFEAGIANAISILKFIFMKNEHIQYME